MIIPPPPLLPEVTVIVEMKLPDGTPAVGWRAVADRIEFTPPRHRWHMPAAGLKGRTKFTVPVGTWLQVGTSTSSPTICTSLAQCCPVWKEPVVIEKTVTLRYMVGQQKFANCR